MVSTETMSVKVPPVSMPMRRRGDAELFDMPRTILRKKYGDAKQAGIIRLAGTMGQTFT
jgi:hypothetical protein